MSLKGNKIKNKISSVATSLSSILIPFFQYVPCTAIWFGIMSVLKCEIGLITPPVGINCYVIAGTLPEIKLEEVFKGIIPFVIMNLIAVTLLIVFPDIAQGGQAPSP